MIFSFPLTLALYGSWDYVQNISKIYKYSREEDFDFCYFSDDRNAFLFNFLCLIFPCLLSMGYNVYCFRQGLQAKKSVAPIQVIERETKTTMKYLGALVVVWVPIMLVNLLRFLNFMSSFTSISIIVVLTSLQGLIHGIVYVMSYKPLTKYICQAVCCRVSQVGKVQRDEVVEENDLYSPLSAYDMNTYLSPLPSSFSKKRQFEPENEVDRLCSAEQYVRFGDVSYNIVEDDGDGGVDYSPDEARDVFNDELFVPSHETRGFKKFMKKFSRDHKKSPRNQQSNNHVSPPHPYNSPPLDGKEKALADYYHNLFHQAH